MWKTQKQPVNKPCFSPHSLWKVIGSFPQAKQAGIFQTFLHSHSIHIPQGLWIESQAVIDVGCDVFQCLLHFGIAACNPLLYLTDAVHNGGMILIQLLADIGKT